MIRRPWWFLFFCVAFPLCARSVSATEPLTRIAEVRRLTREDAAKGLRVHVRGVVTLCASRDEIAIEDDSAGTWVQIAAARQNQLWKGEDTLLDHIHEGTVVEIEGAIHVGGYAPVILPETLRLIGEAPLPAARMMEPRRFFRGTESGQRIEGRGVVLGYQLMDEPMQGSWKLRMDANPGVFYAIVSRQALPDPTAVVNAELLVRGVAGSGFNTRGELLNVRILVARAEDLIVEKAADFTDFAVPLVSLDLLNPFQPDPETPHRLRIQGTVTFALPEQFCYLQEGTRAVRVETRSAVPLQLGDRVEAVGFVDMSRQVGMLGGAEVRSIGKGDVPVATEISPAEIMEINSVAANTGQAARPHDFDGHLVRFRAQLLGVHASPDGKIPLRRVLLKQGRMIVGALLYKGEPAAVDALLPGSELEVTGVVQLEYAIVEGGRAFLRPVGMDLLLRSAADIVVITAPSWWTPGRLLGTIAVVGLMLGGALLWAWQLRRQVQRITQELAAEMRARRDAAVEFQATLRERNRLAVDLHDTLLQTMGGIGFQLEACEAETMSVRVDEKLSGSFEITRKMLDRAVDELRGSVWALRSLPLRGLALPEVLRSMASRLPEGHRAKIEARVEGDLSGVPDFVAGNLLLAAQEALQNALKHGQPTLVVMEVRPGKKNGWIELSVRDDGKGFTPGTQAGPSQGHFGLAGIRERMERLDGTLRIESSPGHGTVLYLEVPLRPYDKDVA